ncbi:MAG: hypothetical protein AB7G28_17560 [Pirellulales bacterium]
MFCSECGATAAGKFCWSCGKPLVNSPTVCPTDPDVDSTIELIPVTIDWTQLTNYEALLRIPEVRDRIARHAALCQKKLTGEEFLEACDKFLTPLTGGVPFTLIAKLTQPLSTRLGLKTGKTRCERLAQPTGTVIVAVLSSLAQNGHQLGEVAQLENGVNLCAAAPSDIWSLKGELHIDIRAAGRATQIEAAYTIPGQLYDWGKSQRGLTQLFTDISTLMKAA